MIRHDDRHKSPYLDAYVKKKGELPKFAMDFVGFASMGLNRIEASIALTPDYDLQAVVSTFIAEDGSRVLTLIFGPSDKKLGRKGYSLKEEWNQEPQTNRNKEKIEKK
jgi:hypothetical protein